MYYFFFIHGEIKLTYLHGIPEEKYENTDEISLKRTFIYLGSPIIKDEEIERSHRIWKSKKNEKEIGKKYMILNMLEYRREKFFIKMCRVIKEYSMVKSSSCDYEKHVFCYGKEGRLNIFLILCYF